MRSALIVILVLFMLLASLASFLVQFPQLAMADLHEVADQNASSAAASGARVSQGGGFQLVPSDLLNAYISNGPGNVAQSIRPYVLLPPFQVLFKGPTPINV